MMGVITISRLVLSLILITCNFLRSEAVPQDEASTAECVPSSNSLVKCVLRNIIRDRPRMDIDILLNLCHQPVDLTFFFRSTDYHWNFTYVPNNQNERVYLPSIFLEEPAHMAPTYLYIREPEDEYRNRNGTIYSTQVTVVASIVAVYKSMWEEEEFLNYTYTLPSKDRVVCPNYNSATNSSLPPWLLGVLIMTAVLNVGALLLVFIMKNKDYLKKILGLNSSGLINDSDAPATSQNFNTREVAAQNVLNNNESRPKQQTTESSQNTSVSSSLRKMQESIKINLKNSLPFKILKEDTPDSRNTIEFSNIIRDGASVTTSNPLYRTNTDTKEQTNDNSDHQFDYGSRDYLDQLEDVKKQVDVEEKRKEWQEKFDEEEPDPNRIVFAKCSIRRKKEPQDTDGKKVVKEALQKGYFSYDVEK